MKSLPRCSRVYLLMERENQFFSNSPCFYVVSFFKVHLFSEIVFYIIVCRTCGVVSILKINFQHQRSGKRWGIILLLTLRVIEFNSFGFRFPFLKILKNNWHTNCFTIEEHLTNENRKSFQLHNAMRCNEEENWKVLKLFVHFKYKIKSCIISGTFF